MAEHQPLTIPRPGKVYLVGAGPGDPGLITLAGLRRLQEADVVVYDRLVGEDLLLHARPDAEMVYVGKASNRHTMTQDEINAVLVDRALAGKSVCRLKGGDPFVFGRGGEEALVCRDAGVPFEVIPGVTSAIAGPAYAGIPVTHRRVAASFAVITGHEDPGRETSSLNWEKLATATDTLVFLMGVERLGEIANQLIRYGRPATTPAALVQWGTHPKQRTLVATLETIADRCQNEGFTPPCITVVGDVVALREELQWFDRRPLFGRRVLVTRSRDQASELVRLLEEEGAQVIQAPAIRVRPYILSEAPELQSALEMGSDWIIFTSVNAVQCFFGLIRQAGGDARSVGPARIVAIGPVTAQAVEAAGLRVDFIPQEALSTKIAASFPEPVAGKRMLIPRAEMAPDDLPEALRSAGAVVTVLPVYETVAEDTPEGIREELAAGRLDAITFTSSSTVRNFLKLVPATEVPEGVKIACIGPVTAETARESGLRVDSVADPHTMSGLVEAVKSVLSRGGDEV